MTAWLLSQIALHIRWPKYWSCSFSTSPFNEYSGLIDWFNCLAVQGTLKSLHQHHNLKASSFSAQLFLWPNSHIQIWLLGKPVLTLQILVSKVIPPLVNMLATFVIAFLPRSKCLFISWLQSPSTVILKPKKIKYHCCHFVPFYLPWSDGLDTMISYFLMLIFKPTFSFYFFTLIRRFFSSSSLSPIRVVSSAYLSLLIFLPENLIPSCASSSTAFHIMFSAYKLNKQGDNLQPIVLLSQFWTSQLFPVRFWLLLLNPIQVSQETGKVVWYFHLFKNFPQFVMIHTVKDFSLVNEAEVDFFWNSLAFSMFQQMLAI